MTCQHELFSWVNIIVLNGGRRAAWGEASAGVFAHSHVLFATAPSRNSAKLALSLGLICLSSVLVVDLRGNRNVKHGRRGNSSTIRIGDNRPLRWRITPAPGRTRKTGESGRGKIDVRHRSAGASESVHRTWSFVSAAFPGVVASADSRKSTPETYLRTSAGISNQPDCQIRNEWLPNTPAPVVNSSSL